MDFAGRRHENENEEWEGGERTYTRLLRDEERNGIEEEMGEKREEGRWKEKIYLISSM